MSVASRLERFVMCFYYRKVFKMQWINGETWKSEKLRKSNWHKWFAWFPVVVSEVQMPDGKIRSVKVWLDTVERKGEYCSGWGDSFWIWDYRNINT